MSVSHYGQNQIVNFCLILLGKLKNNIYKLILILSSFKTHWKILISYVDLALTRSPCDSLVLKTVAYTFLKYSIKIPDWLYIRYKVFFF